MTYAELVAAADTVAAALQRAGVREGDVVAMALSRPHLPAGVLAIMAAGAAYLPVDTAVSADMVGTWLAECSVRTVLSDREPDNIPSSGRTLVRYDEVLRSEGGADAERHRSAAVEDALAYVIPTSGTTRRPKLVAVGHRGLAAHTRALRDACELKPHDRALQFHTINFDAAAEEIYPTLAAGATLVTLDEVPAPHELIVFCQEHQITVLNLPTSYWHQLAAEHTESLTTGLASVRSVVIGGEGAVAELATKWVRDVRIPLINSYGVTESTITSTWCLVEEDDAQPDVPIGSPIDGTTTRILDDDLNPTATGSAGELCIGGVGVAWGYLGEAGLTADKFRPDPYASTPGGRLYRTGDVCTEEHNGRIFFRGRRDLEVKVRGYRIDLSSIEAELTSLPGVIGAAAVQSAKTEGQLLAYLVTDPAPGNQVDADGARRHLEGRLPSWSVPHVFRFLTSFPLTSHGKVDRAALAARDAESALAAAQPVVPTKVAPESTAATVSGIWSDVLGVPDVTMETNFFEAGGHSLLAFRILSNIRRQLAVDVPAKTLFDTPKLGEFTAEVEALLVETERT
ncbi:Carrier domain-containing protein OS=Kitasatospora aureofaciens OX=1894 GN=HS99_0015140 PE=4 SV=1 [Kitasatospora aureofaciens]